MLHLHPSLARRRILGALSLHPLATVGLRTHPPIASAAIFPTRVRGADLHTSARRQEIIHGTTLLFAASRDSASTTSNSSHAATAAGDDSVSDTAAVGATRERSMSTFQRLSMLFNNLPGPKPEAHNYDATTTSTSRPRTLSASRATSSAAISPTEAGSTTAPPIASPASVNAAYATASVVTSLITPQFLVFIRSGSPLSADKSAPLTAESLLAHAKAQRFDWASNGGVSARHILVVSGPESHLTRMAGFPCSTAFYITFPRHETRSPARVKYMEQFVGGSGSAQAEKVATWGWRLMRYPNQVQLCTTPKRSLTAQSDKPMLPRTVLSTARATGLPGWDVLDETMIVPQKQSTAWMRYSGGASQSQVQYVLRVPPHPRYLQAVADIVRTNAQLRDKLGWVAEYSTTNGTMQDVPALPVHKSTAPAVAQAQKSTPAVSSTPSAPVIPTSTGSGSTSASPATPSPAVSSTPAPTRFWCYVLTSDGRLFLEDESTPKRDSMGVRVGLGLKDRRALNVIWSQLRESKEVLTRSGVLAAHAQIPVPIPAGSALGQEASVTFKPLTPIQSGGLPSTPPLITLPLSHILPHYPFLSLCAGELNFIRVEATPVVFKGIVPATASSTDGPTHFLQYAGDLTYPFIPSALCCDSSGRLFHPSPPLGGGSGSLLSKWALMSSQLAQELVIHESPFTPSESTYLTQRTEEHRRAMIEAGEEHQRMMELRPGELVGTKPQEWIGKKLAEKMAELGMDQQLSRYVLVWQDKQYRIGYVDLALPFDRTAHI